MPEKIQYQCVDCKYKFSRAQGHVPNACPLCGKNSIGRVQKVVAEDLLKDVDDL